MQHHWIMVAAAPVPMPRPPSLPLQGCNHLGVCQHTRAYRPLDFGRVLLRPHVYTLSSHVQPACTDGCLAPFRKEVELLVM